jgi:TorA maturation chaperone TorD
MSLPLDLAARLWLSEPDEESLERARQSGIAANASPEDLAGAYTALFVLNVYPYGSVFTDPSAGLNGGDSLVWARRLEESDFRPLELSSVGAPDHFGLCLKYVHFLETRGADSAAALAGLLSWGPVCTLAAERDPMAHQFYRRLARSTREALLERAAPGAAAAPALDAREGALEGSGEDGELRLADIVAYFLAPGRSGFFLSRSTLARMGRRVSLPLPFGGRFETARGLFEAAGVSGRVEALLDQIRGQIDAWEREYRAIAEACPAWAVWAEAWSARLSRSRSVVADLRANVRDFKPSLPSRGADGRRAGEEA